MNRNTFIFPLILCVVTLLGSDSNSGGGVRAYGGSETPAEPIIPDTPTEAAEKEERLSRILFPRGEQNRLRILKDVDTNPTATISSYGSARDAHNVAERVSTACHRQQGVTTTNSGLTAKCTFTTPRSSAIRGTLTLTQTDVDAPTTITGRIAGLTPQGERGFHVHEIGDFSRDCASTLGHYNPFNRTHGGPNSPTAERHVGDFGNLSVDANGVANVNIVDKVVSLFGRFSVIGRAIVIHSGRDDLGEGDYMDSLKTGHSGGRVGCCAIVYARTAEVPTN